MRGPGSDWVKNVEAAQGDAVIRRGRRRRVHLVAVLPEQRAPILREYVRIASSGRQHFPLPATLGDAMHGATCAGLWVTGTGKDGNPREVYLYHVVDNQDTMREYGAQCVVWQTAINPVVALELLAAGTWSGAGVLGPEAFDAVPFLNLLADDYGSPWGLTELRERN